MSKFALAFVAISTCIPLGCDSGKKAAPQDPKAVAKAPPAKQPSANPSPGGFGGGGGIQLGNDNDPDPVRPKPSGGGGFGDPRTSGPNYEDEAKRLRDGRDDPSTGFEKEPSRPKKPTGPKTVQPGPKEVTVMTLTYRQGTSQKLIGVAIKGSPTAPQVSYEWETADGKPLRTDAKRDLCVFLVPKGSGNPIRWNFNADADKGDTGGLVGSSTNADTPPFGQYKAYAFLCEKSERWDDKKLLSNIVEFTYERMR